MHKLLGAMAMLCLVALQSQAADEKKADKSDKDKLQGSWDVVSFEFMGKSIPAPKDQETSFTFKGDKVMMKDNKKTEEGTYKLDETKKLKEIDLTTPKKDDPKVTETAKGLYQIEGDTLKIAMKGLGSERPKGFDDKDVFVMILKCKK